MQIAELFSDNAPVISFEFFPPKTEEGEESLFRNVEALQRCRPSYVSVTYGAGGSTRDRTIGLVKRIKRETGIEPMAHLTCVNSTRDEIRGVLQELVDAGISNVLALRGDPPKGQETFVRTEGGFGYATELVGFIKEEFPQLCVGAAFYPETHVEAESTEADLVHLREKVDAGVDFLVSQLFFDNADYFAFVRRARSAGIDVPMAAGLMPVTNVSQIERFTKMCGARIPQELARRLEIVADDPSAVVATGVAWSIEQCHELLVGGCPGIHFYTLNKSSATLAVHAALGV